MRATLKRLVKTALERRGFRIRHEIHDPLVNVEVLLRRILATRSTLTLAQIGACDGVSFDPIYEFVRRHHARIQGVVVEPLPDLFAELERNYADFPTITPVCAAIHNHADEMSIYRVDPARLDEAPGWAKGISSFDPDHHTRSGTPSELIIEERVRCVSLDRLLEEHGIARLDLLQIDTEGYDAEILLHADLARWSPEVIRFEHGLPRGTMSRSTFDRVVARLHDHGYELALEEHDATAYRAALIVGPEGPGSPPDPTP